MKMPVFITGIVPEFNGIIQVLVEELSKFFGYCYCLKLVEVYG